MKVGMRLARIISVRSTPYSVTLCKQCFYEVFRDFSSSAYGGRPAESALTQELHY